MAANELISLQEATSLLGVSAATMRNWDRRGQLKAIRNPANNYRQYRLSDVLKVQRETQLFTDKEDATADDLGVGDTTPLTPTQVRKVVAALHRVMRDTVGTSSLLERFDEITKVLFAKAWLDRKSDHSLLYTHEPGRTLRSTYDRIVKENPEWFPEPFSAFRIDDSVLNRLAEVVAPVSFNAEHSTDLKGFAFEEVVRNTFEKGDNQQFFTPPHIVRFMADMLADEITGTVCDPACGTGGFLIEFARIARMRKSGPSQVIGLELDSRLAWSARINLALHECPRFMVETLAGSGSLGRKAYPAEESIDCILTNPPFGSDLADPEDLNAFKLGRGRQSRRRGVLFIERCLQLLRPGGHLGIIIDDGVLNGPSNTDTRELILSQADLLSVVSLPETAFMPYASVRASILFMRKKRAARKQVRGTYFAQAAEVGRKPNGDALMRVDKATRSLVLASDLPDILRGWRGDEQVNSAADAFWSCLPAADDAAFAKDKWRLDAQFHHPSREVAAKALASSPFPRLALAELCDFRNEPAIPSKDFEDEEINYTGLANIESNSGIMEPAVVLGGTLKSTVKRYEPGDILFAKMRPELRKIALVPDSLEEGYASAECLVLVPKRDNSGNCVIERDLLAELLRSDLVYGQVVHKVIGIGRPRLGKAAVVSIQIPVPPMEIQAVMLSEIVSARRSAGELLRQSEEARQRAAEIVEETRRSLATALVATGGSSDAS